MANVKISDLPASTTPLVGSEVLPIVQSTSTVNVSVANLTAGRSVSAASIANGLGAVGTPSYTFTGDLNTGMWSPAADTVAVSTDGSERLRIDSSGNVGIGNTPSGTYKLEVTGATFSSSMVLGAALPVASGGTGVTTSTGTTAVVLSNSPTLVTPILGAATATSIANGLGAVGTPAYTFTGDLNTGMWSPGADTIAFSEGGIERMRIDSAGDVGIGTTNPLFPLHVNGEVRGTKFTSDAASQSLANNTDLAILTLTGYPGPQIYQVSVAVNAGAGMTVALVTVGTNGSGGRSAALTKLVTSPPFGTDITVTNVAGTSTVNVKQTTGVTQTITWSITRLM